MSNVSVTLFAADLLCAAGNLFRFVERVAATGCRKVHVFGLHAWPEAASIGKIIMPWGQDGTYTHPMLNKTFPRYRLLKKDAKGRLIPNWNPAYLDRVKVVRTALIAQGIERVVTVNDQRRRDKNTKYWHPLVCSVEALSSSTPGGTWGEPAKGWPMWRHHRALINMTISRWWPIEVEAVNEYNSPSFALGEDGRLDPVQEAWMNDHVLPALYDEIRKRPVFLWTSGSITAAKNLMAMDDNARYSWHGVSSAADIPNDIAKQCGFPAHRIIVSCDGGTKGHGRPDAKGRKGASVEEIVGIVKRCRKLGIGEVEVMDRGLYRRNNGWADLDLFNPDVLAASAKEGARP